ncbi:hypothetical protein [Shewanella vesiculosa]|uniref:hypothetical protein n=1 Tax=Shewanella vesiculosa TaxID=518738 RepID=UPI00384FFC63
MSITFYSRQFLILLMLLGLGCLLPLVFNQGVASAYHFKSSYYLNAWEGKTTVDEVQYRDAYAAAMNAYERDNSSPHYRITLSKVMEWGVYLGFDSFSNDEFNRLLSGAIALRHNWPAAYSDYGFNLAFYQDKPDLAFDQFRIGLEYGPFAPEVIQQILSVGFAYWPTLTMDDKYLVFDSIKLASTMDHTTRNHLVKVVGLYDKKSLVCSYFDYLPEPLPENTANWIAHSLCKKT